ACRTPRARSSAPERNDVTVIGIIGNTHGVSSARRPIVAASRRKTPIPAAWQNVSTCRGVTGGGSTATAGGATTAGVFAAKRIGTGTVSVRAGRQYRVVHA